MAQKSEDLRVRRTRKLLQKALIELTSEKGFANVTVHDLTERAMVNRSTFYRHYLDKYDLLSQYLEELFALLDSQESDGPLTDKPDHSTDQLPEGLISLLKHIQTNADFYRVMLGEKGAPTFCAQSFRPYIEKGLPDMLRGQATQTNPNTPPIDLRVNYLLQAGMAAIVWWLESGQSFTPEQMAIWLNRLSKANIDLSGE